MYRSLSSGNNKEPLTYLIAHSFKGKQVDLCLTQMSHDYFAKGCAALFCDMHRLLKFALWIAEKNRFDLKL